MRGWLLVFLLTASLAVSPANAQPAPPLGASSAASSNSSPPAEASNGYWAVPIDLVSRADVDHSYFDVIRASRLKDKGEIFKSFSLLERTVDLGGEDADQAMSRLGAHGCAHAPSSVCLYDDGYLFVYSHPVALSDQGLRRAFSSDRKVGSGSTFALGYTEAANAAIAIAHWKDFAISGDRFACDDKGCLRIYAVGPQPDLQLASGRASAAPASPVPTTTSTDEADIDGAYGAPTFAVCVVEKVGDDWGAPDSCKSLVTELHGKEFVLSITQLRLPSPPPPPPPPPPPLPPPPPPTPVPVVRVSLTGLSATWLATELEQALATAPWKYIAVATSATDVSASAPFRLSHSLASWHELGTLRLSIDKENIGYLIFLADSMSNFLVSRQNNERDLNRPTPAQWSLIRADLRNALVSRLTEVCKGLDAGACSVDPF